MGTIPARAGRLERGLGTAREIEDAREAREYAERAERKGSGDRGQGPEQNGNRADADHGAQASCLPRVNGGHNSAEVPERACATGGLSTSALAEGTSNRSEISAVTNTNGCAPGGSSSSSNANPDEKQEKQEKQEKPKQNA